MPVYSPGQPQQPSQQLTAGADIGAGLFVKVVGLTVVPCGAGDQPVGVSRRATLSGQAASFDPVSGNMAPAGDAVVPVLAGGTVRRHSYLKPDANGAAVAAVFSADKIGGRALDANVAGGRLPAVVVLIDPSDA